MIDALPLALIAISASDTVFPLCLFSKIPKAMLTDLLKDRAIRAVVEVASNEDLCIGGYGMDRIDRLAETVSNCLAEGTAVTFATIATGQMNYKDMKSVVQTTPIPS